VRDNGKHVMSEKMTGGRCKTRTCDPLRVKQEVPISQDIDSQLVSDDLTNGCTNGCTSFHEPGHGKDLQAIARALSGLTRAEWMTLVALMHEYEEGKDEK